MSNKLETRKKVNHTVRDQGETLVERDHLGGATLGYQQLKTNHPMNPYVTNKEIEYIGEYL